MVLGKYRVKDGRMTRIDLREPKKELQMVMIGFRRRMEEEGKGVWLQGRRRIWLFFVHGGAIKQTSKWTKKRMCYNQKLVGEIVWYCQFRCPNQANSLSRFHSEKHSSAGIMAKLTPRPFAMLMWFIHVQRVSKRNALKRQWTWREDKTRIKP